MTHLRKQQRRAMLASSRRGAITVMVGVMMVVLMTLSAIAVDASRAMAARNELQTAADAAALAAALQLLGATPEAQDSAAAVANTYARRNSAVGAYVDSIRVATGVWVPGTRVFIDGGEPRDAIEVTVYQRVNFLFGGLLGSERVMLRARATAWSAAPVMASRCIKPWAIPYNLILRAVDPTSSDETRELTDADIRNLRELPIQDRTFQLNFGLGGSYRDTLDTDWTDEYQGLDLPAVYRAADDSWQDVPTDYSRTAYRRNIYDCSDSFVAAGDSVRSGISTRRRGSTVRAVIGPREYYNWGYDDDEDDRQYEEDPYALCSGYDGRNCYNSQGGIGVSVKALFFAVPPGWTGCASQCNLGVKMVGSFVLTEIVNNRGSSDHGRITGYLQVAKDHDGTLGTDESTMLTRPVLVR